MKEETSSSAVSGGQTAARRLRLPRDCRLRRKRDYARVYAEGKRARGRLILVIAAPGLNPLSPRMGLSVGRKFNSSAVARNRVRRVLVEAFRLQRSRLPHFDFILIPVAKNQNYRTPEVRAELKRLLQKLSGRWAEDSTT